MIVSSSIRRVAAFAAAGLVFAGPAAAKDIELAANQRAASPKAAGHAERATPERKYCFTPEAVTGSRLQRQKCLTKSEWEAQGFAVDAR